MESRKEGPLEFTDEFFIDDEGSPESPPRGGSSSGGRWARVLVALAVAGAFVLGLVIGRTSVQTPAVDDAVTTAQPPPSGSETTAPDRPTGLAVGGGTSAWIDGEHITLAVAMTSITAATLRLSGPIRLTDANGATVIGSSAFLVAGRDYQPGPKAPAPLQAIEPHQHIQLVVAADLDCASPESLSNWSSESPIVVIPIAGFGEPWTRPLADLTPQDYLEGLCAGTETTGTDPTT